MDKLSSLLVDGDRIFVTGSSNEPTGLLDAFRQSKLPEHLSFIHFPIGALNTTDFTAMESTASVITFFMTPALHKADPERVNYLPMQMRWVYDHVAESTDVALIQVGKDTSGALRMGPNVDFADAALSSARVVIAELNHGFSPAAGAPSVDPARIDLLVESDRDLPELPAVAIDDASAEIGRLVAGLINDGDCLQTGIGAIPAAILQNLEDKNDLGLHGGLIDGGGQRLIQAGNITGLRKEIDEGLHITGMALGDSGLHDWLSLAPTVAFKGANYTHEASVIRQLSNFVSVNSAVEVDLLGQVNGEFAGGKQISGTGGSVDFMRAAKGSRGGRSIVAMNATAKGGTVSRIVPRVAMVTALRTDIDIVVTEYGVAHVKDLPNRARAEALIQVAAPQFRDELTESLH